MAWYNGSITTAFIDSTQILEGGGGANGQDIADINQDITDINQDITDINENLAEFNEVFKPKVLNVENASLDTIIVNNTANSRIFIKNANTTEKIKIEGGKLYLYYDFNFTNAPTIPAGWIDVDNYITNLKQQIIGLELNIITIDGYLFTPPANPPTTLTLQGKLFIIDAEITANTGNIAGHEVRITALEQWVNRNQDVDNSYVNNAMDESMEESREILAGTRDTAGNLIESSSIPTPASIGQAGTNLLTASTNFSRQYLNYALGALGGAGAVVGVLYLVWEYVEDAVLTNLEAKTNLLLEKTSRSPTANNPVNIYKEGLLIIDTSNNNLITVGDYTVSLSNGGKLLIGVSLINGVNKATIKKVLEIGSPTFSINNVINIPKSSIGGTTGNLEIQVLSLASEKQVLINQLQDIQEQRGNIRRRGQLRDGLVSQSHFGDGLTIAYNSTSLNMDTGEILQVPTIKLNLNSGQLETINGVLNIKKYVNTDTTDAIQGSITAIQGDITAIGQDLSQLNSDIIAVEGDVATIEGNITTINGNITTIEGDITTINGNITTINGNIATIDNNLGITIGELYVEAGKIVVINANLDKVYKLLLPTGATLTSGYKMSLGYKEYFTGYAYDLIMMAIKKDTYSTFVASNYNNDFLGYFPNMGRIANTGEIKSTYTTALTVSASQHFTKGLIYLKNTNPAKTFNMNRKFEFITFLKFVSFNNNTTDYHIVQTGKEGLMEIDNKLSVYIRDRKLCVRHPASVSYNIYTNGVNTIMRMRNTQTYQLREPFGALNDNIIWEALNLNFANYKLRYRMLNVPYLLNNESQYINTPTGFLKITDSLPTTPQEQQDTKFIALYLNHPSNPNQPIVDCFFPSVDYLMGINDNGTVMTEEQYTIPWYIKRVVLRFDVVIHRTEDENPPEGGSIPWPVLYQEANQNTLCYVVNRNLSFRIVYSYDGINLINHDFTIYDVFNQGGFVSTGTTIRTGWYDNHLLPKKYLTYTFEIPNTYPIYGQKVRIVKLEIIKKILPAYYPSNASASIPYNGQPVIFLYEFNPQEYTTTESGVVQTIYDKYVAIDTQFTFTNNINLNQQYLTSLQLDLPNNSIKYLLDTTSYTLSNRGTVKINAGDQADIIMPHPNQPFVIGTFINWAKLTQDNSTLVVGNNPTEGEVNFTHFNWRFFQSTETFLTTAQITKLMPLISSNYYYDYVNCDKLLNANEIFTNNVNTNRLMIGSNVITSNFTPEQRAVCLRSDQTQDSGNLLIDIKKLYVANPTSSGSLFYNHISKNFGVGSSAGGIGSRAEEDEITLGLIEDSAGFALQWNPINKTLNVIPENIWQDLSPYALTSTTNTKIEQTSNFVIATSNFLQDQINSIPPPYDDTGIYAYVNTKDLNVSNYVVATSNFLQTQINSIPPPTPAYDDTVITQIINTKDGNVSNYVVATSNFLQTQINSIPPPPPAYDDTTLTQLINTKDGNVSNYVVATSNFLNSDYITRDDIINTTINTKDGNVSNYVIATSNFLQTQINSIPPPTPPYDDTTLTQLINTKDGNVSNYVVATSNFLNSDYITRDNAILSQISADLMALSNDYVDRDTDLTTDYIARDVVLNNAINANAYNDGKVNTYLTGTLGFYGNVLGNTGIGTNVPQVRLHIHNNVGATRVAIKLTDGITTAGLGRGFDISKDGSHNATLENYENTAMYFTTNATERMRITNLGDVGIGTEIPQRLLHLHRPQASSFVATKYTNITTTGGLLRGFDVGIDGSQQAMLQNYENTNMYFSTNGGTGNILIQPNGNVGIGTNNIPFALLHLHRIGASQDVRIQFTDSTTGATANSGTIVGKLSDGRGFLFNYHSADLFFGTAGAERMRILANGNVGIGTTTTTARFRVEGSGFFNGQLTCGTFVGTFVSVANTGTDYLCVQINTTQGLSYQTTARIAFGSDTSFHRCYTDDILYNEAESDLFKKRYEGRLVISTGKIKTDYSDQNNEWQTLYDKDGITIEDSLPIVALSRKKKDKRIFGVLGLAGRVSNNKNRLIVNSGGEGAICVANSNGNIENGDYIQSSDLLGYGERQEDGILYNYTVAKATMDCDFQLDSPYYQCYEENNVRYALISCTYHCG